MTLNEFINKWNGKYLDFDGAYGNQCMDLMHQYCVEVLGLADGRILAAPGAKDVYNNFENIYGHEYFDKIPNTPDGVPQEGDILFWGWGTWGHVAVFIQGDVNTFKSFDQNYPNSGDNCHIQTHNYSSVLGWLRFKNNLPLTPALQGCQTQLKEEINKKNALWNEKNEVLNDLEGAKSQIQHYTDFKKQLSITLNCTPDEAVILGEITKLISVQDNLNSCQKSLSSVNERILTLENEKKTLEGNLETQINNLKEQNQIIEKINIEKEELSKELSNYKGTKYLKSIFNLFGIYICVKSGK